VRYIAQLTYYHGDDGGQLLVDGNNAFRHYHIGPSTTSAVFKIAFRHYHIGPSTTRALYHIGRVQDRVPPLPHRAVLQLHVGAVRRHDRPDVGRNTHGQ